MNRSEFIDEIFMFFRCKDEHLKSSYDMAFSVKETIDWEKLYALVVNEAETRYLPAPKWFKAKFPLCRVQYNGSNPLDGTDLEITFENGRTYSFVLYETTSRTLFEVEQKLRKKFAKEGKNIKEIKFLTKEIA